MVRCDMEGVTGIVSYEQTKPGSPEYIFGQSMLHSDLMALVQGLLKAGADEIVLYDGHVSGRNIDLSILPEKVNVISGKPPYRADWAGGLDDSFTGAILLGFHSKYGTPKGLLHHSYEHDIRNLCLNGVSVGEIGIEAAIAGDCGVPVLMVTADSAGASEAQSILPNVCTVVVKESLGTNSGHCYPVAVTAERIHSASEEIIKNPPGVSPYEMGSDVTLEIELNDGPYLDIVRRELKYYIQGASKLVLRAGCTTAVWADYWQKKLHCQEIMRKVSS